MYGLMPIRDPTTGVVIKDAVLYERLMEGVRQVRKLLLQEGYQGVSFKDYREVEKFCDERDYLPLTSIDVLVSDQWEEEILKTGKVVRGYKTVNGQAETYTAKTEGKITYTLFSTLCSAILSERNVTVYDPDQLEDAYSANKVSEKVYTELKSRNPPYLVTTLDDFVVPLTRKYVLDRVVGTHPKYLPVRATMMAIETVGQVYEWPESAFPEQDYSSGEVLYQQKITEKKADYRRILSDIIQGDSKEVEFLDISRFTERKYRKIQGKYPQLFRGGKLLLPLIKGVEKIPLTEGALSLMLGEDVDAKEPEKKEKEVVKLPVLDVDATIPVNSYGVIQPAKILTLFGLSISTLPSTFASTVKSLTVKARAY